MLTGSQHNRYALMHVLYCLEVGIHWEKTRVLQQIETLLLTNQISAFILFIRSLTISYCMCVIPILLINNSGNLHYNWCQVQQIHSLVRTEFRVFCCLRLVLKITTATVAYICTCIYCTFISSVQIFIIYPQHHSKFTASLSLPRIYRHKFNALNVLSWYTY